MSEKRITIHLHPDDFPVLTARYSKDAILDMGLEILEKEGLTAERVTSASLGTALANLESDLQSMFPQYREKGEGG